MTEIEIVSSIQRFALSSPLAMSVAVFCARYLIGLFIIFALYLFFNTRGKRRHGALEAMWAAALALALTAAIAAIFGRLRPFQIPFDAAALLIPPPLNSSFPSGHTGTSVAMAAAIFFAHRKLGIAAIVAAALVALGRVAVGVHYPTDLIGGIAVGLASFWIVRFMHMQIRRKDIKV